MSWEHLMNLQRSYCLLMAHALLLASAAPAPANENLRIEVREAARNLKKFLEGQNQDSIAVGHFSGPPEASGGILIEKTLAEELAKLGISNKLRAPIIVEGSYHDVTDKASRLLAAKLEFKLITRQREVLHTFEH